MSDFKILFDVPMGAYDGTELLKDCETRCIQQIVNNTFKHKSTL